jgi:uncharacterized protein (DUF433 family)
LRPRSGSPIAGSSQPVRFFTFGNMEWRKYITSDPKVLAGKPSIKGTRLSVEFILGLMAKGCTETALLENYERLKAVHLRAIYGFMSENIAAGHYPRPLGEAK